MGQKLASLDLSHRVIHQLPELASLLFGYGAAQVLDFRQQDPTTGAISVDHVIHGARTEPYFQTDFSFKQEFAPSKAHEGYRVAFEANIFNLLNQRASVAVYPFAIPTNLINPARVPMLAGDPGVDWAKVMNGYN